MKFILTIGFVGFLLLHQQASDAKFYLIETEAEIKPDKKVIEPKPRKSLLTTERTSFQESQEKDFQCLCGQHTFEEDYIVGGQPAPDHSIPWQVRLESDTNDESIVSCGGTLISSSYIITAAHCLGRNLRVFLGGNWLSRKDDLINYNKDVEEIDSSRLQIFRHPGSRGTRGGGSDLAIIRVKGGVHLSSKVVPACFPSNDMLTDLFHRGTVSGWGGTTRTGQLSPKLKEAKVTYSSRGNRLEAKAANGIDGGISCAGDSGAPLTVTMESREVLIGTLSTGTGGCHLSKYSFFIRLDRYRHWLKSLMFDDLPRDENCNLI